MKFARLSLLFLALPLVLAAADHTLKIDRARSFIEVDVKTTLHNFTAHLDTYDLKVNVDDAGKIKGATLLFHFSDLRTGDDQRNNDMLKWLGGPDVEGRFDLGILAVAPDGQGQATGRLTFHNDTRLIEFPVQIDHTGAEYTVTASPSIDYREWNLKIIKRELLLKVSPDVKIRFKVVGANAG